MRFGLSFLLFGAMQFCAHLAFAQMQPIRSEAMDDPNKHAWDLFVALNWPAKNPQTDKVRGVPDPSKPFGAPGTTTVWETWREATPEVFTLDGSRPPNDFNDLSLIDKFPNAKVPEPAHSQDVEAAVEKRAAAANGPHILFNPDDGIAAVGSGGFGETRMNKATYDFVLKNGLYSRDGQIAYAQAFIGRTKPALVFPPDSIEVKAAWIKLSPEQIAKGEDRNFYVATYNKEKYGLATLHITTKDMPNWFWSTFHHQSITGSGFENGDNSKKPAVVKGTVWDNYVLGGVQTDFITPFGDPTLLSDAYIEQDFRRSSCITCHARASRGLDGKGLSGATPSIGIPNPQEFEDVSGNLSRLPLDFLFSLQVRARPVKGN